MASEGRNPNDEDQELNNEGEENQVVPGDDEKEQRLKEWGRDQSRSFFSNVRRKYNGRSFQPWSAEIRKPIEISDSTIMLKTYTTDVEAAVAASVVARIFEIVAQPIRNLKNSKSTKHPRLLKVILNKPMKCYDYLINRNLAMGIPLPDCHNNDSIREFVQPCHTHFMELVRAAKNNPGLILEDPTVREDVNLFCTKAMFYDQLYPEDGLPPEKQAKPHTNNRRKGTGTGARSRRGFIELDCSCDHHPRRKILKWEFDTSLCLCSDVQFRLIEADPAASDADGALQTDPGTSHPPDPHNSEAIFETDSNSHYSKFCFGNLIPETCSVIAMAILLNVIAMAILLD